MIRLLIDGQRVDLSADYKLPKECLSIDLDRQGDLAAIRKGRSVELEIPSSRVNDRLLCYPSDAKAAERFNESYHEAQIEVDGTTLMRGVVHLVECSAGMRGAKSYRVRIYQGGDDWVESLARRSLDQTELEYGITFDGEAVERSWSEDVAVRFLPINYDSYAQSETRDLLLAPQHIMTLDNYYPFLSVEKFVRAMFAQAGYEVESRFFESEEFGRLMMSGKYATMEESKQDRLAAYTGFEAGRSESAMGVANSIGRVWISALVLQNSAGNFVNTTDGEGLYNSGGVLTISDDEGLVYYPKSTQMVGFEYELHYRTEFEVLSRKRLQGFDSIYLGPGADFRFELKNPLKDWREELRSNSTYDCCIFDFEPGQVFRLIYTEGSTQTRIAEFSSRIESITTPFMSGDYSISLQIMSEDGTYLPYTGDWAMYEAFAAINNQIEVALTLRTPAEQITPSTGKSFNQIYIYGAAEGQRLTLLEGCRLRSIFSPTPTLGTSLSLQDVTPKDVTQLELLEALQQMFNLRFITSEAERRVYIEPLSEMIGSQVVDWRERVVYSDGIVMRDLAAGVNRERRLAYRAEVDGAVGRFNEESESDLGEWQYNMKSYISSPARKELRNPLFSPTLTAKSYVTTPSAEIMQVGDRDSESQNFSMRIVSYRGLVSLPSGECWGYPSYAESYPYAAFHGGEEFTLCFEDRDGVEGLHRYYDAEWREQDESFAVELSVKILPHELERLRDAAEASKTFGSLYLLNISGESALYRLQAVETYDAERAVARCLLHRMLRD